MTIIRKLDIKDIINPLSSNIFGEVIISQKPTTSSVNDEIINQGMQYFYTDKKDKSTKEICKTYTVGYMSKYAKLIKMFLNKWIPNTNKKDRLDENSDIFDAKTSKILLLFNNRFGIKAEKNEITMEHMKIFKDIFNNTLSPEKYPIKVKEKLQKSVYEIFRKYDADKAVAKLTDKPKINHARKSFSSRHGHFAGSIRSNWGSLTPTNITSRIGIKPEIANVAFMLKDHLAQYGYSIIITSGKRSYSADGSHTGGRAVDFTVYKNGIDITRAESITVVKLINEFKTNNGLKLNILNEYIQNTRYKKGSHIHISTY